MLYCNVVYDVIVRRLGREFRCVFEKWKGLLVLVLTELRCRSLNEFKAITTGATSESFGVKGKRIQREHIRQASSVVTSAPQIMIYALGSCAYASASRRLGSETVGSGNPHRFSGASSLPDRWRRVGEQGTLTSKASSGVSRALGANPTEFPLSGSTVNIATLNSSRSISPVPSTSHSRKYFSAFHTHRS